MEIWIRPQKFFFGLPLTQSLVQRWQMEKPLSSSDTVGDPKGPCRVAFHRASGATVQSGHSGTFLWQPGNYSGDCQAIIDVTAEVHRTSTTYITIDLPRSIPPSNEICDNAIRSLIDVFRVLVSQDSSSVIYVFPTKARKNPQAQPMRPRIWHDQSPDRSTLEIYAH